MPTPGSETYKSSNPIETRDKSTYSSRKLPEVIAGPDVPEIGPAPTLTALEPNTLTVDDPDTEVTLTGENFTEESVIVWNGGDEVTDFVDSEHLSTTVKPSTVEAELPFSLPVVVRNGQRLSNEVTFTFIPAPEPGSRESETD